METDKPNKRIMSDMVPVRKAPIRTEKIIRKPEPEPDPEPIARPAMPKISNSNYASSKKSGCGLWMILAICIIAVAVTIGGLFTHATITITPKQFSGDIDTTITMSQNSTAGTLFFATATKTFSNEKIVPATSFSDSESFATGTVRFFNSTTTAKTIPTDTIIISSKDKKYKTDKKVTIPAQKLTTPGHSDVDITAVEAGSDFNNDQDDFVFEKPDNWKGITASTVTALVGGASGREAIADPTEIANATEILREQSTDIGQLIEQISAEIPDDMIALPISVSGTGTTIVTESNHDDGVHVVAKNTITIIIVRKTDFASMLAKKITDVGDVLVTLDSLDGLTILANTVITNQTVPTTLSMRVTGTATVMGDVHADEIKAASVGVPRKQIKESLDQNPAIETFTLRMLPFWRRTMPGDVDDITVMISE